MEGYECMNDDWKTRHGGVRYRILNSKLDSGISGYHVPGLRSLVAFFLVSTTDREWCEHGKTDAREVKMDASK